MTSLPDSFASSMHLPFNQACLAEQLTLQSPSADPGGPGYRVLLRGSKMLVAKEAGRFVNGLLDRFAQEYRQDIA